MKKLWKFWGPAVFGYAVMAVAHFVFGVSYEYCFIGIALIAAIFISSELNELKSEVSFLRERITELENPVYNPYSSSEFLSGND